MSTGRYTEKDRVLQEIRDRFLSRPFSDEDLLSLGKYFFWYARYEWADELI
ncbi:hypothetical protein [Flaviaesturariibacter flavus]|uniref:hypothetical protein n=1 Tax=Flaviaesturariibacter flavus TaxID=2502780 RepID=UPI0014054F32|nr:hypothetical protein [Flaviaesturariibacter flavus]